MAVTLYLYYMDKPRNCIKGANDATLWCSLSGDFKQPYDVMHPRIVIRNPLPAETSNGNTFNIGVPGNYAVVYGGVLETISRQYWIYNYVWLTDELIELQLEEDVLSTFGDAILASTQYVTRSSKRYTYALMDSLYPVKATDTVSRVEITSSIPWHMTTNWLGTGYFVVGIINDDDSAYGSVSYYMFNCMSYNDLRKKMLSSVSWTNFTGADIEESLYKSLFDPMQYITTVQWYPTYPIKSRYDDISNIALTTIKIGWWPITLTTGCECKRLESPTIDSGSFSLSEYHHPSASTRGIYFDCPPYLHRSLIIPPFGEVQINTALLTNSGDYPVVYWYLDYITGQASIMVRAYSTGAILGQASAQLSIPMMVAQSTQDLIGAVAGTVKGGVGIAQIATGSYASGLSTAANGIQSAVQSLMPQIESAGINGSALPFTMPGYDQRILKYSANEDNARFGRPLCETQLLNDLATSNGYEFVLCHNADMRHTDLMTEGERKIVEESLNTGVYLYDKIIIP